MNFLIALLWHHLVVGTGIKNKTITFKVKKELGTILKLKLVNQHFITLLMSGWLFKCNDYK